MYYLNPLPTLPLWGEIRPTVVESCLDLSVGVISCSGFLLFCQVGFWGAGGGTRELFGRWSLMSLLGQRVGGGRGEGLMIFSDVGPKFF